MFKKIFKIFKKEDEYINKTVIENIKEYEIRNGVRWTGTVNNINVLILPSIKGMVAIKNSCPHRGLTLIYGQLAGDFIICPSHDLKISFNDPDVFIGEVIKNGNNFYLK